MHTPTKSIFVFGSNLRGIHGAGAAAYARDFKGAIYGQGFGPQGHSWAIPTKDERIQTLPLDQIEYYVECFKIYADRHQESEFLVTRIGCGLAGLKDSEIAPMFDAPPINCIMPYQWRSIIYTAKWHDEGRII